MFNTIGFNLSAAGTLTYSGMTAVSDQAVPQDQNGRFIFPKITQFTKAVVLSVGLTAARIEAPSLRAVLTPEVYPSIVAATVPDNPHIAEWFEGGPKVLPNEPVQVTMSHTGAGPDNAMAALWAVDKPVNAPPGPIFTALATTPAMTLTVNTWVFAALTFNQTLPAGLYSVIGMNLIMTGAFIGRLVFPSIANYRPGCLAMPTYGFANVTHPFRAGNLGEWGQFYNTAQPGIEVLGLAAGAQTGTVLLDLVKVA